MSSPPRGLDGIKINYKTPGNNGGSAAVARTNATNSAIYANATNAINYQQALTDYVQDETEREIVTDLKNTTAEEQYKLQMQNRDIQMDSQLQAYERESKECCTAA